MSARFDSIILHVGLHKTGSTSIQNCSQFMHRDLLLANGIQYACFRLEGKLRPNHGGIVTAALLNEADKYGKDWRYNLQLNTARAQTACREQLAQTLNAPEARTLLLSGEIFSVYNRSDLMRLRDHLLPYTRSLRVLVVIRNPLNFVESALQQRVRAGKLPELGELGTLSRKRYLRLKRVFPDTLEVLNFDDCVAYEEGLVGAFYRACGIPAEQLVGLDYGAANPRSSLEAFRIMHAINQRFPNTDDSTAAALRKPRDMQPLYAIPGARFSWNECADATIYEQVQEERHWFEQHLGLAFRDRPSAKPEEIWSFATLAVLEYQIRDLEEPLLREAATDFLEQEAGRLAPEQSESATILRFIVRRLREAKRPPPSQRLRDLGLDYFRAGAQQVRAYSPELAIKLLRVALEIRPDARDIAKRLEEWEKLQQ